MSDNNFDALTKMVARSVTRRDTVRGMAAMLGGALLAAVGGKSAFAMPPRTCASCVCGTGKPCNSKGETTCTELGQTFPDPAAACTAACEKQNKFFCGGAAQFHCPKGCPA